MVFSSGSHCGSRLKQATQPRYRAEPSRLASDDDLVGGRRRERHHQASALASTSFASIGLQRSTTHRIGAVAPPIGGLDPDDT